MTHSAAHEASLSLTSRADRGGYVIAALSGELGIASAPALREQLLSLLRAASHLIMDLSAVEHADASGLAVLVGSRRRARLLGGSLRLAAPSPEVQPVRLAAAARHKLAPALDGQESSATRRSANRCTTPGALPHTPYPWFSFREPGGAAGELVSRRPDTTSSNHAGC